MKTLVHTITTFVIFARLLIAPAAAADATRIDRDQSASQVAEAWFNSLIRGNTAVTTSLSDVPFSFDREKEIDKLDELQRNFDAFVADKGGRDLKPSAIEIKSSSPDRVEIVLKIGDEGIVVFVRPGDAFKVVGFWG